MIVPPSRFHRSRRRNLVSGRTVGIIAGGIVAVFAAVAYNNHQNSKALGETFSDLDNQQSVIFTSIASCAEQFNMQRCQDSQAEALRISRQGGTSVSYGSGQVCATNHNNSCREEVRRHRVYQHDYVSYRETRTYYPAVAGWQAARRDLDKAVPLYQGPDESALVRKDGKLFVNGQTNIRATGPSY